MSPERLRSLHVVLTPRCNLRCAYCWQGRGSGRPDPAAIRAAIDRLMTSGGREVELAFTGGEPLLEKGALRGAVAYAESRRPRGTRLRLSLLSNGTLLDDDAADFLAAHGIELQVSFDGLPASQTLRGETSYRPVRRALSRLRRRHRAYFDEKVSVAVTTTPATVARLPRAVAAIAGLGVRDIVVTPAFGTGESWDPAGIAAVDRAVGRLADWAEARRRRGRHVPVSFLRVDGRGAPGPRRRGRCSAERGSTLALDVDGRAYACVLAARSYRPPHRPFLDEQLAPMALGSIESADLGRRLASASKTVRAIPVFSQRRRRRSSFGRCGSCAFRKRCPICPIAIAIGAAAPDPARVPDFPCAFFRCCFEHRERLRHRAAAELPSGMPPDVAAIVALGRSLRDRERVARAGRV